MPLATYQTSVPVVVDDAKCIADKGCTVVGIDPSETGVAVARQARPNTLWKSNENPDCLAANSRGLQRKLRNRRQRTVLRGQSGSHRERRQC